MSDRETFGPTGASFSRDDHRLAFRAALNAVSYRKPLSAPAEVKSSKAVSEYSGSDGVRSLWADALSERLWHGKEVRLVDFALSEWSPLQPGQFWTPQAESFRTAAMRFVGETDRLGPHFAPMGKSSMLEGGIGCVRLGSIQRAGETWAVLGGTSSKHFDGGISLLVHADEFARFGERLRGAGLLTAMAHGRLEVLPRLWQGSGDHELPPNYVLKVSEISVKDSESETTASANITFHSEPHSGWMTSFCRFTPGAKGRDGVNFAADWMRQYAEQYGGPSSRILADFDVYNDYYFEDSVLPVADRLAGRITLNKLRRAAPEYPPLVINGNVVLGDYFSGVTNSTIVNRSSGGYDIQSR